MMSKSKLGVIAIVTLLLLSLSVSLVAAQYTTQKTTAVTVSSDGTFTASEPDVGVSYAITGTPGASGTVTADVYSGNPQATASIPNGTSLTKFIVITFDMSAADFSQATINITYTDADVQNIQSPYAVYKYMSNTNSYVALPSTVDTAAKTITVTLTSIDDPLLAIGGATSTSGGLQAVTWAIVIVAVIAIVLVAVLVVSRIRHPATNPEVDYQS
jgi:hypothetical protein